MDRNERSKLLRMLSELAHPTYGDDQAKVQAAGFLLIDHWLGKIATGDKERDTVEEFARFLGRHVHRKGELETSEAHALYEDFYGPLEKEADDEPNG